MIMIKLYLLGSFYLLRSVKNLKIDGFKNELIDIRDVFKSDNNYQNANIDWV